MMSNHELNEAISRAANLADLSETIGGFFERFGKVERVQLLPDHAGRNERVGCMVDMESPDEAHAAQSAAGVTVFGYRTLILFVALPEHLREAMADQPFRA